MLPVTELKPVATDAEIGAYAITLFWQAAQGLNDHLPRDWDSFVEILRRAYFPRNADEAPEGYSRWKSVFYPNHSPEALEAFADGLGMSIRNVEEEISPDHIQRAMQALAHQGGGLVPATSNAFFGAIQNDAQNFSFYEAASFVVKESAAQVAQAAQQVGDAVIDTGASILKYRNYILIAAAIAGAFYVYKNTSLITGLLKKNPEKSKKKKLHLFRSKSIPEMFAERSE